MEMRRRRSRKVAEEENLLKQLTKTKMKNKSIAFD
jgi:hypothetical protein